MVSLKLTSVLILYVFLLETCYTLNSSCDLKSELSDREYPTTVLKIKNCEWTYSFKYLRAISENLRDLKAFNLYALESNAVITLHSNDFNEARHLRTVNIIESRVVQVDEDSFEKLTNLEVVNLNHNRIVDVPQGLFRTCNRLEELYLRGNRIKTLPEFVFSTNTVLSVLDLSYNYLEVISSTELFRKTRLKQLYLEGNRITTIYKNTFTELYSLEFLNLSRNKMSFSAFPNCNKEPVSYPENSIWLVDMAVKTNSCVIDFSYNEISGLPLFGIHKSCNTHIHNRCKPLTLLLAGNPLSCDCEGYELVRYFQTGWPPNVMQAVRIVGSDEPPTCTDARNGNKSSFSRVDIERIYCTLSTCPNCPSNCSCQLRKHTPTVLVDCTRKHLEAFPRNVPVSGDVKSEFWLSYNRIPSIDVVDYSYRVRVLALAHNRIRELPQNFAAFSNLKVLELHDNDMTILTPDHVKHLIRLNLERLTLGNNPWNCSDCRIISFVNYLRNSSNLISDRENVTCFNRELLVVKLDVDTCNRASSGYLLILVASFLSLVVLAIVLLLWYKVRPQVFMNFFDKSEDVESKLYDAFVSYAHQDEDYVVSLVQSLEARKDPFKICLHSRDWVPGEFIVKQMADSVNSSRASVIVLSEAYFRSKWCYSEFRIALTQMLVRRNHKVIVVWLSDQDPSMGKLDPDVRLYFKMCTYLKYDDKRFLNKLELALCTK